MQIFCVIMHDAKINTKEKQLIWGKRERKETFENEIKSTIGAKVMNQIIT